MGTGGRSGVVGSEEATGNLRSVDRLRRILRDASLGRALQDEVLLRGETLDPHGEERRLTARLER